MMPFLSDYDKNGVFYYIILLMVISHFREESILLNSVEIIGII